MESYKQFIARKNKQFEEDREKGKLVGMKDIGRKGRHGFKREAWTFMVQENLKEKVFVIERLRRMEIQGQTVHRKIKIGDFEYRFGYYMIGKIGRAKGKWVWGQFCPLIPKKDLNKLLYKASKEGTVN